MQTAVCRVTMPVRGRAVSPKVESTGSGGRLQLLHIVGAQLTVAVLYYEGQPVVGEAAGGKLHLLWEEQPWSGAKLPESVNAGA